MQIKRPVLFSCSIIVYAFLNKCKYKCVIKNLPHQTALLVYD